MKNILIIHETLAGGGAERVLIEYLKNFDYTKYNVTLLLIKNDCLPHYRDAIPKQVKVLFVTQRKRFIKGETHLFRWGWHDFIEKRQLKKLPLGNYDVIISFTAGSTLKYHSHLVEKATRNITWVHIDFEKNHWTKVFFKSKSHENELYNRMTDIVFVAETAKTALNRVFQINDSIHQKVIYNPIDRDDILSKSSEFNVNKAKFTVIGVGRLVNPKRFDRFIDVAKILIDKNMDMEFWILGTGDLETSLKEKVKNLNLADHIFFKGFVDNPYPSMKSADVFLLTSDTEAYPTVVCESLVLGTPVITTEVSGAKELLGESEFGIITRDMNPETIAAELEKFYFDKQFRDSLASKAQERAGIFNIDKTMNEIYQLLDDGNTIVE